MTDGADQPKQRSIGRVRIDVLTWDAAIEQIIADIQSRTPTFVTFCNAHSVNLAQKDDAFAAALAKAKVLNDGVGVDLASRLLYGEPFPANLCGTDFVPAILSASPSSLRLFLIGSAAGVGERAGEALAKLGPGHKVVGAHHGFFAADEEEEVRATIATADPNLVLVGMGQPRQELWASRNFEHFPAVTMCVGALLEFAAGTVPRAPRWMRTARIEWVHRLICEPRRLWRRYLVGNVEFVARVLRERKRSRAQGTE
jgi:alpha-1,3-mannosyltransferase